MCEILDTERVNRNGAKMVSVNEAVGMIIPHDITEIIPGEFKGRAFKKGHIVSEEDIVHLKRLGKENLFILEIMENEMHENDAAYAIAKALAGEGVEISGEPNEGKINLIASRDGLLKINREALLKFNMLGEVMCATLHDNSVVKKGQVVAGTRAIPLVVKRKVVEEAVAIAERVRGQSTTHGGSGVRRSGVLEVREMRKPKTGIVITGNEVYYGRIKDAFAPILTEKLKNIEGEIIGIHYAPDNAEYIGNKIRELITAGADLIITTGGMSVDPDDVTRFAIRNLGAEGITYGSPVLPGSMFLVAYIEDSNKLSVTGNQIKHGKEDLSLVTRHSSLITILGIPACGMYANITVFDLILPRVLAGEKIGRREVAELGHGGLCLKCKDCR